MSAGVYRTRSEAFADAVSASSKYYIPTPSPTSHEVVAAVKGAGGVILIAHAGDVSRNRRLLSDDQIEALISEGLDGLEVWHRGKFTGATRTAAHHLPPAQLLVTGGSDWHGKGKPNKLGGEPHRRGHCRRDRSSRRASAISVIQQYKSGLEIMPKAAYARFMVTVCRSRRRAWFRSR